MATQKITYTLCFSLFLFFNFSHQLHPSQYRALLTIKHQLDFPQDHTSSLTENQDDLCVSDSTQILTLACFDDDITQLHVAGDPNGWFPGLSRRFSTPALFSTIAQLPNLKILSLVSLGLRGPLPPEIGALSSLEILNVSSNGLNGPIPGELSLLRNLQTLIMDHNNFTGGVPEWLASLPELSVLSLRNNSFNGSFPGALSGVATLRALVLSGNNLSGQVPGLLGLTNLQVLDLGNNNLGPEFPTLPRKLVSLVLRMNKFHSVVVLHDELSSCYQLQKLDISSNQIVGILSPSLMSLPSLDYLDVSANRFTGRLTRNMTTCNARLKFVNLSGNQLTGDLPDCLKSIDSLSYDGNCLSDRNRYQQHPLSFCHVEALAVGFEKRKRPNRRFVVVFASVVAVVGTVALVGLLGLFLFEKRRHCNVNKEPSDSMIIVDKVSSTYTLQLLRDARYISQTIKFGTFGIPHYRTFVLDELKEATSNFSALNLIGEGSCGQVYKGCLADGSVVAIRRLKVKRRQSIHSYTHQLEMIAKLRHCHLISAIGHCFQCYQDDSTVSTIFLVFEFGPNGTLQSLIAPDGRKFTWIQRIAAGIGVARGIQFLHTGGVYSNRLKIKDILLGGDLHVKISKYNLPLLTENRRRLDEAKVLFHGAKENPRSMSEKSDVYDFGVILLELIVGRPIISVNDVTISRDILSVSLKADSLGRRSIMDPAVAVEKECSDESIKTVVDLCIRCLSKEPSVEDVIWNLQYAAQLQETSYQDSSQNC